MPVRRHAFVAAIFAVIAASPLAADPGTVFTYQGELRASGDPVEGTRSMSVTLWDALAGGTQVAGPLDFPAVTVTAGNQFYLCYRAGLFGKRKLPVKFSRGCAVNVIPHH